MTYRELFEKALEALETNNKAWKHLADSGDAGFWEAEEQPFYEMSVKAIAALRQAIEQEEQQEPVAWIEHIAGGVEYNPYHKAALKLPEGMRFDLYTAPPQQEPLMDETDVLMLAAAHGIDAATVGLYSFYVDCMSTTPPQRKPLTDEEIVRLMVGEDRVQLLYSKPSDPYFSEFAEGAIRELVESGRAIERAHGITGDNT